MSDPALRIAQLFIHPIKSCSAVAVEQATLIDTGFEYDREWMVVDRDGDFLSQRELPRMALVQPTLRTHDMVLRAPGMLALHVQLDAVEGPRRVRVWDDEVEAFDMGDLVAQWFSDFLGQPARLARFDPDAVRLASARWAGAVRARTAFSDQFPLLVASSASLAELNRRLAAGGHAAATMQRFRPNIVLDGVTDANGEDFIDTLDIDSPDGAVHLKVVKPCTRCSIPDVDPQTADTGRAVGDTLLGYRADPRMDGALTFGQHAVIVSGVGKSLRVGAGAHAELAFGD
jgi:uncharacterized protein YcbX